MIIYRVYDSSWGEENNVRYYLKEETARKDYESRQNSNCHMDSEDVIED